MSSPETTAHSDTSRPRDDRVHASPGADATPRLHDYGQAAYQAATHAQAQGDQTQLVRLIEAEWPHLLRSRHQLPELIDGLDQVRQELPTMKMIRALSQHPAYPTGDLALPDYVDQIEEWLCSSDRFPDDSHRISIELAVMLTLKDYGEYKSARQHAEAIRWIMARSVLQDHFDSRKLARANLHTGIVNMLVGDLIDADADFNLVSQLPEAYPSDLAAAAGELAFIHALNGDYHIADPWFEFANQTDGAWDDDWIFPGPHAALYTAYMIKAADHLDWVGYDEALGRYLTARLVLDEHLYLAMYARSRAALMRGQQKMTLDHINHIRQNWPKQLPSSSLPQTLIGSIETDLALSIGDFERAKATIPSEPADHRQALQIARWQLATGHTSEAIEQITAGRWLAEAPRRGQVDLNLALATAQYRIGDPTRSNQSVLQAFALTGDTSWLPYTAATVGPEVLRSAAEAHRGIRNIVDELESAIIVRPTIDQPQLNSVSLTTHEHLILNDIAAGKTAADTAERLQLSVHTVRNYIQRIYRKLNATSRQHALDIATSQGLLDDHER